MTNKRNLIWEKMSAPPLLMLPNKRVPQHLEGPGGNECRLFQGVTAKKRQLALSRRKRVFYCRFAGEQGTYNTLI